MASPTLEFIAVATEKAAAQLSAAVKSLPADRQSWSPLDKGRTALDQLAECTIINNFTKDLVATKKWAEGNFALFETEKARLAADPQALFQEFDASVVDAAAAIRSANEAEFEVAVAMPWGSHTVAEIVAYPLWNMSYHEGQVNYISKLAE